MPKGEELKLPIIQGALPAARHLSMDEYLEFVACNLKYTIDKKSIRKQKRVAAVGEPFFYRLFVDLKSAFGKGVRVQIPPPAL